MYDEMAHRTFSVNSTVMTYNILKYEHYLPQLNLHTANNMVEVKKGCRLSLMYDDLDYQRWLKTFEGFVYS